MMLGLRWTLGIVTALVAGGWVALVIFGSGFRSSFGGSENPPWMIALPMVVGGLVIASLLWPESRPLLHVVAAIMLLMAIGSAILARESVVVATLGLLYAGTWLWFYYGRLRS